ncbi:hypothetical protein Hanom_Chr14g01293751 [Helianthus anomalus]
MIFFERLTNSSNGLLTNFIISRCTSLRNGENPHLGPKPVNTRPKARWCGDVKSAKFKIEFNLIITNMHGIFIVI